MIEDTNKQQPILIYLGDLVHNYIGKGPFMFPINIGYLETFTKANLKGKEIVFKLFKHPKELLNEIEKKTPHFLGLSNYTWNADIDDKILQFAKEKSKDIITLMGGPNIDQNQIALNKFFEKRKFLDFYVFNQGEIGFLNLVLRYLFVNRDLKSMKTSSIEGVIFYDDNYKNVIKGQKSPEIKNLDIIPSPYLEGTMDKFFESNQIPNIETNRGCPYTCTYCDWGSATQHLSKFSLERLKKEFGYISNKIKNTSILYLSDANFGIYSERDYEIAKMLKSLNKEKGYPRNIIQSWAKNKSKEIIKIAETLGNLTSVTASFQSLDPIVLKAIKRNNISTESYKEIIDYFNENNIESYSELILGLSKQTKESHLNDLKRVEKLNVGQIVCYNCRMLEGAEMNLQSERERYKIKTKHRLVDQGFGKYKNFLSFETEEMVISTNSISEEEVLFFRPLHWMIYYVWNFKYHYILIKYLNSFEINLIDFLIYLLDNTKKAPAKVEKLIEDFKKDSKSELFDTKEELVKHYSKPKIFEEISKGEFGKLNFKYIFRILIECSNEFDEYVFHIAKKLMEKKQYEYSELKEIIKFENLSKINFNEIKLDEKFFIEKEKSGDFNYNILKWKEEGYKRNLKEYHLEKPIKYLFYVPDDQFNTINQEINQFKNINLNLTLRKMSEHMKISDLSYKVKTSN